MAAKPTVPTFGLVGTALVFFEGMWFPKTIVQMARPVILRIQFKFVTQLPKETARLVMW